MFLLTGQSGYWELLGMILIFVLILVASYYTTKWIGKSNFVNRSVKNIAVKETYQIAPGKVIQIVKAGSKYIVLGVTKDHINMLTELSEEEYIEQETITNQNSKFQDVLSAVKKETFGRNRKKDEK